MSSSSIRPSLLSPRGLLDNCRRSLRGIHGRGEREWLAPLRAPPVGRRKKGEQTLGVLPSSLLSLIFFYVEKVMQFLSVPFRRGEAVRSVGQAWRNWITSGHRTLNKQPIQETPLHKSSLSRESLQIRTWILAGRFVFLVQLHRCPCPVDCKKKTGWG